MRKLPKDMTIAELWDELYLANIHNSISDVNVAKPTPNHGDPFAVEFPWAAEMREI